MGAVAPPWLEAWPATRLLSHEIDRQRSIGRLALTGPIGPAAPMGVWIDADVSGPLVVLDLCVSTVRSSTGVVAGYFVFGETRPGVLRVHFLDWPGHDEARRAVRGLREILGPLGNPIRSFEIGSDAACVEHDDCAADEGLGVACWRSRRRA